MALHVGDVRRIARKALHLVEHTQEDLQDGVAVALGIGLGVDVEEDDIGLAGHSTTHVADEQRILDLRLEELRCAALLSVAGVGSLQVGEQVRQDLDEVRLAGTEEARHPHPHARSDGGIGRVVDRGQVGVEEPPQVLGHLLGGDVLVQFLPDAFVVALVGLDDTVDRAVDLLDEEFFDFHGTP